MKFKVGDRVTFIQKSYPHRGWVYENLKINESYFITDIDNNSRYILLDNKSMFYQSSEDFELAYVKEFNDELEKL